VKAEAKVYSVADNVKLSTTRSGKSSISGRVESGSFVAMSVSGGESTTTTTACFLLGMIIPRWKDFPGKGL
jgi:hypothetical protein